VTLETLWADPDTGCMITHNDRPSEQTIALLEGTVWGSRATRYRILGIADKLACLRDPSYFILSEQGRELCVFVLDFCHKRLMDQNCGAWHFVMAATVLDRQNEGLAGLLIEHVRTRCIATVGNPGFGYAYVEASTVFSLKLSEQIGYTVDATIPLTLFSRLNPRAHPAVTGLRPENVDPVLRGLETLYGDHELTDFGASLRPDQYLTLHQNGRIVAGAQAELLRWSVQAMPGAAGKLLLNVLPHLPAVNRFLDLRDLRMVRFGNLLVPEGSEAALFGVLETALVQHRARIGLIMLDQRSEQLQRIRDHGRLGLLSGALKGSAKLHIDVVGMNASMLAHLANHPLLVSAGDVF
jgi:hypothetical protein